MQLSVVICTWNPRESYLRRTLSGLEAQTLPASQWELVVIDNNSTPSLSERGFDLPANGRIVREPSPGLTAARLRGIGETAAPLIVFVDDDNVLAPDYLEKASHIAQRHPMLGAWGGRSLPEFETPPPDWMKPFWANLALHDFPADRWTNQRDFSCFPCGAGMCLRREVANLYVEQLHKDGLRRGLGRTGLSLSSGEDTDLVLTALASGWGIGKFTSLSLLHLIPKERLTLEYHCRLARGMGISIGQLNGRAAVRNPLTVQSTLRGLITVLRTRGPGRKVRWAAFKAYREGLRNGWGHR